MAVAVCVLAGELAAPGDRSVGADVAARGVHRARSAMSCAQQGVRVRVHGDLDRLNGAARRRRGARRARDGRRHASSASTCSSRTAGARSSCARRSCSPHDVQAGVLTPTHIDEDGIPRAALHGRLPRSRPADSHVRRTAAVELPALAGRVRRVVHLERAWPDFGRPALYEAILDFQGRDRRFGRVSA